MQFPQNIMEFASGALLPLLIIASCSLLLPGYAFGEKQGNAKIEIRKQKFLAAVQKRAILPLQLKFGVPYFSLWDLCEAKIESSVKGSYNKYQSKFKRSSEYEEYSYFSALSSIPQIKLLLDTGSNQFWLADSQCQNCPYSSNLCPIMNKPQRRVSYVKGYAEGVESYIHFCGNRVKYLCVKEIKGMGALGGHGIMGLRPQTIGMKIFKNVLNRSMKNNKQDLITNSNEDNGQLETSRQRKAKDELISVSTHSFSFNYGRYVSKLQIKAAQILYSKTQIDQVKNQDSNRTVIAFSSHSHVVKTNSQWAFPVQYMYLSNSKINISQEEPQLKNNAQLGTNGSTIPNAIKAIGKVDTGSSKIVLSQSLCSKFLTHLQEMYNTACIFIQGEGIQCDQVINEINFGIGIAIGHNQSGPKIADFTILSKFIIDYLKNRVNIICHTNALVQQENSKAEKISPFIILGEPFLRSHLITFSIQTISQLSPAAETNQWPSYESLSAEEQQLWQEQKATSTWIQLGAYPQDTSHQEWILRALVFGYIGLVILSAWGMLAILRFVSEKREKTIVI